MLPSNEAFEALSASCGPPARPKLVKFIGTIKTLRNVNMKDKTQEWLESQ